MKKFLALVIIVALVGLSACKKKEEQQQPGAQQPGKTSEFQPAQKKKKNAPKPVASSLKIFQETQLLKTVTQAEYPAMATTKIKVGAKELHAITLKELLAKNNLKSGKRVTLDGQTMSAQLTWEQANSGDLYIYVTPKKFLKIQAGKSLAAVKFPKRLESITVSATEVAAKTPEKKPAPNK